MRFDQEKSNLFSCKIKNEIWFVKKIRSVFWKGKKKDFLEEDSHSWGKLTMHASHIK